LLTEIISKMHKNRITHLKQKVLNFLTRFATKEDNKKFGNTTGNFGLFTDCDVPDLYGMIDAVYTLYLVQELEKVTDIESRNLWAQKIRSCQDDDGWFTKRNLRGHSKEHATAYAISALRLLEVESPESYVSQIKPLDGIKEIFKSQLNFEEWIDRLGFKITFDDPVGHAGWHYIWRSSHLGGGITAALGMTRELQKEWWPKMNTEKWFNWYFNWLDKETNPQTGYWQRAIWNWFVPGPTLIDMAGAVHFYWVYEKYGHPLPYPEKIIESTLKVQKETGLYRDYPMCIDLDGNFCLTRAYNQLPKDKRERYYSQVNEALTKNFNAVLDYLDSQPLEDIYDDSHGLPGALAALAECQEFEGFSRMKEAKLFNNPFNKVWWL